MAKFDVNFLVSLPEKSKFGVLKRPKKSFLPFTTPGSICYKRISYKIPVM